MPLIPPVRCPWRYLFWLALLLSCITPPSFASEVDFSRWSNHQLFERADLAYHDGDYLWALKVYRALLGRDLEPARRANALYNQGLCFEMGRFWADAEASYQTLVSDHPDEAAARDGWFRLGVMHEVQGEFGDAATSFAEIMRRYRPLSPADRRAVEVQLAWQQVMQGEQRRPLRRLERVMKQWSALTEEARRDERFYIGKAHTALGMLLTRYAEAVQLTPARGGGPACLWARAIGRPEQCLKRQLQELEERMTAAGYQFGEAARQRVPIWTSAGYYCRGVNLETYYRLVCAAPPPATLTDKQREIYRRLLRARLRSYLVNASQVYGRGHELAEENGDDSEWARWLEARFRFVSERGVDGLGQERIDIVWKGNLGGTRFR